MSPRTKAKRYPDANLSIRLAGAEAERYDEVLRRAFGRNPRASKSDVARRLLNLDSDTDGLVTDEDVLFFQGRAGGALPATERSTRVAPAAQDVDSETRQQQARKRLIYAKAKTTPDEPVQKPRRKVSGE
jgi:hypothetical protein